jgi:hypothetical protein
LELANNHLLKKWYAQNNILIHSKVKSIPIGLEDAWRHNNGIVSDFNKLRKRKVVKKPRVLFGFNINNNINERLPAYHLLKSYTLADEIKINSRSYRKILNEYMFIASPIGNGLDCHRTWEAMYLNTVPIVLKNDFYDGFNDFPGLILNSWNELLNFDESKLMEIYKEKSNKINNSNYMWIEYWEREIKNLYPDSI